MKHSNSFSMKAIKSFMTIALLFVTLAATAQVNFSGTWAVNAAKNKTAAGGDGPDGGGPGGPGGPMGASNMIVKQEGNVLTVEKTMRGGPDGDEMKMSSKYNLDGTVSENSGFMDMKSKSTVVWSADKKSITISTTMVMERDGETREMKTVETWTLNADGSLSIASTRPGRDGGEEMKTTTVYDKK